MSNSVKVKTVLHPRTGEIFILIQDVVEALLDLAATESTDTRNRIEELARNFERCSK